MSRSAVRRILATLLAALLAAAGASSLETIEFDGFVVTYDSDQA